MEDKTIRKRCITCDGTGMMEIADPKFLRARREEYIQTAGNSPEEVLRKVRYLIHTPEGEDVVSWARLVFNHLPKIYQKYPNKLIH